MVIISLGTWRFQPEINGGALVGDGLERLERALLV